MDRKPFVVFAGFSALVTAACATTGTASVTPDQISQYAVAGVKVANAAVEIAKAVTVINQMRGEPKK